MLTSTHFWMGVGAGVLMVYGYHMYAARKSAAS